MANITVIGAGMMGTAMCWPLSDNHHQIKLVGTPLDFEIIDNIQHSRLHPKLQRDVPQGVEAYQFHNPHDLLAEADLVISGVSSFGVEWFIENINPHLRPGIPVLMVTKGLHITAGGQVQAFPDYMSARLETQPFGQVSFNAIAGPCIAHELAARRQTSVVFTGHDAAILQHLVGMLKSPYYHIHTSTAVRAVEICAALKNGYAMGISMVIGQFDQLGPDGLANLYNPQAALFAQSIHEMRLLIEALGDDHSQPTWLPGAGDLFVTVFGGRTRQYGRLIGSGLSASEAREQMSGVTLESIEIINLIGGALEKIEKTTGMSKANFPLMDHLYRVMQDQQPGDFPWEKLFTGRSA